MPDSQFGYAVGGGGDVNGDGYADFSRRCATGLTDGQVGEGGAWLFCGGVNSAELCWHDDGDLAAALLWSGRCHTRRCQR